MIREQYSIILVSELYTNRQATLGRKIKDNFLADAFEIVRGRQPINNSFGEDKAEEGLHIAVGDNKIPFVPGNNLFPDYDDKELKKYLRGIYSKYCNRLKEGIEYIIYVTFVMPSKK